MSQGFKAPASGEVSFRKEAPFIFFLFLREALAESSTRSAESSPGGVILATFRLCFLGFSVWAWAEELRFSPSEVGCDMVGGRATVSSEVESWTEVRGTSRDDGGPISFEADCWGG